MKADEWWRQPLADWAETAGFDVKLEHYAKPQFKRGLGEWWVDAGHWSLHLNTATFARFEPNPDVTIRRTLSWLLDKLRRAEEPSAQVLLKDWFEHLLESKPEQLEQIVNGTKALSLPEFNWADYYESGWFALFTPQYPQTVSLSERTELRQNMTEVLRSYLGNGIVGWLKTKAGFEHILVHVPASAVGANNADMALQAEESDHSFSERNSEVHSFAEQVLDALTQDVLVSCDLAIGAYFETEQKVSEALLTVALLRRKLHSTRSKGIVVWGEHPVTILLHTAPQLGIHWFLEAVQLRAQDVGGSTSVPQLPEELTVSLRGIVQANLNVSEAARDLFIHRNTLIHRLDRIKELTGYDARVFQDALILWLTYLAAQMGHVDVH